MIQNHPEWIQAMDFFSRVLADCRTTEIANPKIAIHGNWYESRCNIGYCSSYSVEFAPKRTKTGMILRLLFPWTKEDFADDPDWTEDDLAEFEQEIGHPCLMMYQNENRVGRLDGPDFEMVEGAAQSVDHGPNFDWTEEIHSMIATELHFLVPENE